MFPVERTFSEWSLSEYAAGGVYAPQFAGDKPDGIVSTCQDCHMRDVTGRGCEPAGGRRTARDLGAARPDRRQHLRPGHPARLLPGRGRRDARSQAGKARATAHAAAGGHAGGHAGGLRRHGAGDQRDRRTSCPPATPRAGGSGCNVAGLGRGRRRPVYESGAYDAATGVLTHDADVKIYEIEPGLSPALAAALGLPAGPSFHFVLNDTVYFDNRIPPRGFTNAAFEADPVAAGRLRLRRRAVLGRHRVLPARRRPSRCTVTLYYQTTTKEYVEFLRDENDTNTPGRISTTPGWRRAEAAPVVMAQASATVDVTDRRPGRRRVPPSPGSGPERAQPVRGLTRIAYDLARGGRGAGGGVRPVRTAGAYAGRRGPGSRVPETVTWDGRDDGRTCTGRRHLLHPAAGRRTGASSSGRCFCPDTELGQERLRGRRRSEAPRPTLSVSSR